jgi:hypothetical protein
MKKFLFIFILIFLTSIFNNCGVNKHNSYKCTSVEFNKNQARPGKYYKYNSNTLDRQRKLNSKRKFQTE